MEGPNYPSEPPSPQARGLPLAQRMPPRRLECWSVWPLLNSAAMCNYRTEGARQSPKMGEPGGIFIPACASSIRLSPPIKSRSHAGAPSHPAEYLLWRLGARSLGCRTALDWPAEPTVGDVSEPSNE